MYTFYFRLPVKVFTACAAFPNEILILPESLLKQKYPNIIQYNVISRGGHFAAFEEPRLLANDIFSFVKKIENLTSKSS